MNPKTSSFEEKIDVHGYEQDIHLQIGLLEKSSVSIENKDSITDFFNYCRTNAKIGPAVTIKYLYVMRRIGKLVDKPFKEMGEKDINALLAKLQDLKTSKGKPFSIHTMNDFRKTISKFWRWLYFDEYYGDAPPPIKRMQIKAPTGKREPEIYTKEEIKSIIDGTNTIRDRAFFSCLYDLSCRVSELLSRQVKHVRYNENGDIQILIEAEKTSISHWETLFESVSYFTTWFRLHQRPNDPNAPLWTMQRKGNRILPVTYPAVRKVFISSCKRQNLRQLKIHTFRKSKATHDLADGVPITYIESRGSWSKGSQALQSCYLSIQQKDKENAYRKKYSMIVDEKTQSKELRKCNRCESVVQPDDKFCSRCGMPADKKIMAEISKVDVTALVDKNILSELVKRLVLEEMEKAIKKV